MSSPVPKSPYLKAGTYDQEASTFGDVNNLLRFFATKSLRASLQSPPLAYQVGELEFVFDKTTLKLWTKIDGVLKSVTFS